MKNNFIDGIERVNANIMIVKQVLCTILNSQSQKLYTNAKLFQAHSLLTKYQSFNICTNAIASQLINQHL
jgi:hypothetical protein